MTEKIKVRWLIAHFPQELFVRTAKEFKSLIEKMCPGEFEFEIHNLSSFSKAYSHLFTEEELKLFYSTTPEIVGLEEPSRTQDMVGPDGKTAVVPANNFKRNNDFWKMIFRKLEEQAFEITQNQVSIIGSHLDHRYHAVDLPFLWKNHDHVSEALDGEIGDRLGKSLGHHCEIRGLGFTYSGGYRIVGASEEIKSIHDLSGKDFITSTKPSNRFFKEAGVDPILRRQVDVEDLARMSENGGAIETTYLRFGGKHILKTNHSMFTTSILASQRFLNSLTEKQKKAVMTVAKMVAKKERVWSLEDADKYEQQAVERGITINDIDPAEETVLREAAKRAFGSVESLEKLGIDPEMVEDIMKIGEKY